jgi:deoxyribonuclease-4
LICDTLQENAAPLETVVRMMIGSHVDRENPLHGARKRGAEVIQLFLSPPQSWVAPKTRGDETELRNGGVPVFVHAPYLANPSSLNPEVRSKTRTCLQEQTRAAAAVGALGVVVHGGHPTGAGTVQDGINGWLEVLDGWIPECRILVENTAGGKAAVARKFDDFKRLLDAVRGAGHEVGVCLDTCHAHAGGEHLTGCAERLLSFAGSIELVHLNDSKDLFDSGRDRHENLGAGVCGLESLIEVAKMASTYTVVETPGDAEKQGVDVALVRKKMTAI